MKSLVITAILFLTLTVGAQAQENQKIFTAEEQAMATLHACLHKDIRRIINKIRI